MTDQTPEFSTPQEALAHYGVKGMRWGVRRDRDGGGSSIGKNPVKAARQAQRAESKTQASSKTLGEARREVRDVASTARSIISESKRSPNQAGREAAAKRYEEEVLAKIKTPEFKETYRKASTMGKGEMALHVVAFGPLSAVTIPAIRSQRNNLGKAGYELEVDMAHDILREMRS